MSESDPIVQNVMWKFKKCLMVSNVMLALSCSISNVVMLKKREASSRNGSHRLHIYFKECVDTGPSNILARNVTTIMKFI